MFEPAHSESLEASLSRLKQLDEAQLELGKHMFEAFDGAVRSVTSPPRARTRS